MARHNINIQDGFLFQNLKDGTGITVELITGQTLKGRIRRFDRFALIVDTGSREILVYKHAISTIGEGDEVRQQVPPPALARRTVEVKDRRPRAWTSQ